MNIITDNESGFASVEIGDIIYVKDYGFYIIADEKAGYIARKVEDWQGLCGYNASLSGLSKELSRFEMTHYSKNQYSLKIVKK